MVDSIPVIPVIPVTSITHVFDIEPCDPEPLNTGPTLEEVRASLSEGFCPMCHTALIPRKIPEGSTAAVSAFCIPCNTLWALTSGIVHMHWQRP